MLLVNSGDCLGVVHDLPSIGVVVSLFLEIRSYTFGADWLTLVTARGTRIQIRGGSIVTFMVGSMDELVPLLNGWSNQQDVHLSEEETKCIPASLP